MNWSYLRLASVFIFFTVAPLSAVAITAQSDVPEVPPLPSPCIPLGDINGDGLVTSDDATLVHEMLSGVRVLTDAQAFEADVTSDGSINDSDAAEINAYLQKTLPVFSGCLVVYAPARARAERDARRLADLSILKGALVRYARDTGTYPTYPLVGTPSSDGYWKSTIFGVDFRKKLKAYINPLPIDPLNIKLDNFRYVYATIPLVNPPWGKACAGATVLFAARTETSLAGHEECDLGDGRNHFTLVLSSNKTALSNNAFASAFSSFLSLFSLTKATGDSF
ncbi:MAG: hypothetical protein EXS51_02475 [Candidatus Taylorbacteria bacterium]|nr:hypothetical protein [Candidatus Taylorbacteria bacterium]